MNPNFNGNLPCLGEWLVAVHKPQIVFHFSMRFSLRIMLIAIVITVILNVCYFTLGFSNFNNQQKLSEYNEEKISEHGKDIAELDLKLFDTAYDPKDFVGNAQRMRILAKARKQKYNTEIVKKLENYLFPWIKPFVQNLDELEYKFKGRGMVICVSNRFLTDAITTIGVIRNYFKSKLPIEIMHLGNNDLSTQSQEQLLKFSNIKLINLQQIFPKTQLQGWDMKPFAMLASSFDETIIMDADVIFVQSPENLFNAPKYNETGTVFFRDRVLWPQDRASAWAKTLFDEKGFQSVKNFKFMQAKTSYEQESGVVLIRKSARYFGLLVTCWMNLKSEREIVYSYLLGDKETFWMGFTIVHEPFGFVEADTTALIGEAKSDTRICSTQLAHLDWNSNLFWFNSGLLKDKGDPAFNRSTLAATTHYGVPGSWIYVKHHTYCLESKDNLIPLSVEVEGAIETGKKLWLEYLQFE